MSRLERIVGAMRQNPCNVAFSDLAYVCETYFGEPRQKGTSHRVYRTPWSGDPRINRYADRVVWSQEDGEYVGTVAEMPSLSWLADTPEKAFDGIRSLAVEAVADMEALGEAAPAPIASRAYSGKFQVRIPPELHRRLAMEAAEERVSLNRLVAARLA